MAFVLKILLADDLRRISVQDYTAFSFVELGNTLLSLFGDSLPQNYTVQYIDDEEDQIVVSSDDELQEGFRVAVEDNRKPLKIHVAADNSTRPVVPELKLEKVLSAEQLDTPPVSPREPEPRQAAAPLPDTPRSWPTDVGVEAAIERERELKSQLESSEKKEEVEAKKCDVVFHKYVVCDGCGMNPIQGVRYKSSVVEDFDLCSICEDGATFEDSHAPFLKINTPDKAPKTIVTVLGSNAPNWRDHHRQSGRRHGHYGRDRGGGGCHWRRQQQQQQQQAPVDQKDQIQTAIAASLQQHPPTPAPPAPEQKMPRPMSRFVTDVTIPDGTKVVAGKTFVKTWRMRNDGKAAWPVGSRLMPVGGDNMTNSTAGILVVPAGRVIQPRQEVDITVELQAPARPGRYVGHFRMAVDDQRFGHRVWADIIVVEPQTEKFEEQVEQTATDLQFEEQEKFFVEQTATDVNESLKMSITPDVALAVSAKLCELQAAPAPVAESTPTVEPVAAEQQSSPAGSPLAKDAFVMVDNVDNVMNPLSNALPESLLSPLSPDEVAPPAPPAYAEAVATVSAPAITVASPSNVTIAAPAALIQPITPVAAIPAADLINAAIAGAAPAPKYENELNQLSDMGFFDIELMTTMLEAEKGNVQRVLETLLS